MMLGLLCFGAIVIPIAYFSLIAWASWKIQGWAMENGYPAILIPWAFVMVMGVALPFSVAVAVSA